MNLFPLKRPTLALSISETALCLVEVKQSWRSTTLKEVKQVSLPSGVIHLSSAKPNIKNIDVFVEQLRNVTEGIKKPISIALSLPDLCARTSVFDFSTFPTKTSEQTALVNWRFQQDLKLDTTQSRLSYAVYIPTSLAKTSQQGNPESVRVLGTAIRNEIIEQYERACLDIKLMPVSVSVSGLDVFDLYQRTIHEILEVEHQRTITASTEAMFLFISQWGFTFFAFHDGYPTFVRTKAIRILPASSYNQKEAVPDGPHTQETLTTIDGEDGQHAVVSQNLLDRVDTTLPYPFYTTTKVEKEILATLQYYLETFSLNGLSPTRANLFVVSDLEHGHMLLPASEDIQQTAKVSGVGVTEIHVTQLSNTTPFNRREGLLAQRSHIWSALPGYASLRVA